VDHGSEERSKGDTMGSRKYGRDIERRREYLVGGRSGGGLAVEVVLLIDDGAAAAVNACWPKLQQKTGRQASAGG
jgi:hypothetical protein